MFSILTNNKSSIAFLILFEISNLYNEIALNTEVYFSSLIIYLQNICEATICRSKWTVICVFKPFIANYLRFILRQIFLIRYSGYFNFKLRILNTTRSVLLRHKLYLYCTIAPVFIIKVPTILLLYGNITSLS